jgi:hypothetical protein
MPGGPASAMLTIAIIFTLLVALWGHRSATSTASRQRDSKPGAASDHDRTPAIASRGK